MTQNGYLGRRAQVLVVAGVWSLVFGVFRATPAYADPPTNDNFPGQTIGGSSGSVFGTNVEATAESGETPNDGAAEPIASVWYSWVAPSRGSVTFDTCTSDYDTTLGAYTSVAGSPFVSNDDACGTESLIEFVAESGTTYYISVDGFSGGEGTFTLNWNTAPANDNFSPDGSISGTSGSIAGTNVGATVDPGETPNHGAAEPIASVWYTYQALSTGTVTFDTCSSDYNTTLGAYTSFASSPFASNNDVSSNNDVCGLGSRIAFSTVALSVYYISVDGYSGGEGTFTLRWNPSPPNDNFPGETISGTNGWVEGTNLGATAESGEPPNHPDANPIASVWYSWVAPLSDHRVTFYMLGCSSATLATYTSFASSPIESAKDGGCAVTTRNVFVPVAGTTYYISVDGEGNGEGTFRLAWSQDVNCNVRGTPGDDTLIGTDQDDVICGEGGNDTILPGAGDDIVAGGDGSDTVSYLDIDDGPVTVNLGDLAATGPTAGTDALYEIDNATGTNTTGPPPMGDTLIGDGSANVLSGGMGPDDLDGGDGNDTLDGDSGNDALDGGDGADELFGGVGKDRLNPGTGNDAVSGGPGIDTLSYEDITSDGVTVALFDKAAVGTVAGTDNLTSVEIVRGTNQPDDMTEGLVNFKFYGLGGADTIDVADGDGGDFAYGGPGTDTCYTDPGDTVRSC